jgi:hypothetical protein
VALLEVECWSLAGLKTWNCNGFNFFHHVCNKNLKLGTED